MIIRIVKMVFMPEHIQSFVTLFNNKKESIRNFNGCLHLELLQNTDKPNEYFTYSYWKDAESLEQYRLSGLFKETWANTKILFAEKPKAWSTQSILKLN